MNERVTVLPDEVMRVAYERWSIEFRARLAILPAHVCADVLPPEKP